MARALVVPSGTGDVQVTNGSIQLYGYSVRESAGSAAAAELNLRDGDEATDPIRVATIELAANGRETVNLPGVQFSNGIYVDRVSGSTEIVLYIS